MKSTREKIMRNLLAFPDSTINDLAEAVGINGISIRHHLTALEAEGLITSSEERHGVGRPRFVYQLSESGVESFPTSYLKFTKRLLESLKNKFSSDEIKAILAEIGSSIAEVYEDDLDGRPFGERVNLLPQILTKEGFMVEMENQNGEYILKSFSCPYHKIGLEHPEICFMDQQLITQLVSKPVQVEACICSGDDHCTYRISQNGRVPADA